MNRNRKKVVAASVAVGMTMVMGFSPVLAANTDISKEETVYEMQRQTELHRRSQFLTG